MSNPTEQTSIIDQLNTLPPALQKRVYKNLGGAILMALVILLLMICTQDLGYAIGLLFSLYIAWLGLDIMWKYHEGKVVCKKVRCLNVKKILSSKQLSVSLLDIGGGRSSEDAVRNFYVTAKRKDAAMFFEDAILNIYISNDNASELYAWALIDTAKK